MVIDFKYYIITIITIFISLGLGILIGSSLGGNELVADRQQQLINDLEYKLTQLKDRNEEFKQQVSSLENQLNEKLEFQKTTLPLIVQGELENKSLLLVSSSNIKAEVQNKLKETFRLAGAERLKLVSANEVQSETEFQHVVFLGEVEAEIQNHYEAQRKETVVVNPKKVKSLSGLIEVVFKLNATDLEQVGSVDFEFESFGSYSGL